MHKNRFLNLTTTALLPKQTFQTIYHTMCAVAVALGTIVQQTWRTATAGHPLKTQATINM